MPSASARSRHGLNKNVAETGNERDDSDADGGIDKNGGPGSDSGDNDPSEDTEPFELTDGSEYVLYFLVQ